MHTFSKIRAGSLALLLTSLLPLHAENNGNSDNSPDSPAKKEPVTEYGGKNALGNMKLDVLGDFELTIDPADGQSLLMVTDMRTSAGGPGKDIILAQFDSKTGLWTGESQVIASNYVGNGHYNGPEFALRPPHGARGATLGILYAGDAGVYSTWRDAKDKNYCNFDCNVSGGKEKNDEPVPLSNTAAGSYPNASPPFGQNTYASFIPPSNQISFGYLKGGNLTNVAALVSGSPWFLSAEAVIPDPTRENRVYFSAHANDDETDCGIYSAEYNMLGALSHVKQVLSTSQVASNMVAGIHPVTKSLLLFAQIGNQINTYQRDGGPLNRIATVTPPDIHTTHFRAITGDRELVLYFACSFGSALGSYTMACVQNDITAKMTALPVVKISNTSYDLEMVYLPAAKKWADYIPSADGSELIRNWIKVSPDTKDAASTLADN